DEVLCRVDGGEHGRVVDRRLRAPGPVAIQVRRQIVGDPDEPRSQWTAVRLVHGPLEVPVGLQERLLRQVLGVVVVPHPVVGVRVDVPQVCPVELRELAIELLLVHAWQPTQAARERPGRWVGADVPAAATIAAPSASASPAPGPARQPTARARTRSATYAVGSASAGGTRPRART